MKLNTDQPDKAGCYVFIIHTLNTFNINKVQINKNRMYEATNLVLDINSSLFKQLPELAAAHQRLKTDLQLIDDNRQGQEANS